MSKNKPRDEQPQPQEAFGHPVTKTVKDGSSDHKPGYVDSPQPAKATAAAQKRGATVGAIVPPRKADKLPKLSLAEKLRQRLSEKEEE